MRVYFDESVPRRLGRHLRGHECILAVQVARRGDFSGTLVNTLDHARYDALVTLDATLADSSGTFSRHLAVIALGPRRMSGNAVLELAKTLAQVLEDLRPGEVAWIAADKSARLLYSRYRTPGPLNSAEEEPSNPSRSSGGNPPEFDEILTLWRAGIRSAEWPSESITRALEKTQGRTNASYARLLAYYHDLDRGRFPEALQHIRVAYSVITRFNEGAASLLAHISLEAAYILGRMDRAVPRARHIFKEAMASEAAPTDRSLILRAQAALEIAEGSRQASRTLDELEETLRNSPKRDSGTMQAAVELMEDLRRKWEKGRVQGSVARNPQDDAFDFDYYEQFDGEDIGAPFADP